MDDNGLLKCTVEISSLGRVFDMRNFYTPSAGHQNFEGNDGESLAGAVLADAERDLEAVRTTLGEKVDTDVERLRRRVDRQREALSQSVDADTRRSVTEEARAIRQEISRLKHAPENRADVLLRELAEAEEAFDRDVREDADGTSAELFDRLLVTVRQSVRNGDMAGAERALKEMEGILYRELGRNPAYLVYLFKTISSERYRSVDKALHDRLVSGGAADCGRERHRWTAPCPWRHVQEPLLRRRRRQSRSRDGGYHEGIRTCSASSPGCQSGTPCPTGP
jgi:molecular chaperone DnaK